MMISAYLLHAGIKPHAEAALIEFGQRRTANAKGVTIASQMRWVHYYDAILSKFKRGVFPPNFAIEMLLERVEV